MLSSEVGWLEERPHRPPLHLAYWCPDVFRRFQKGCSSIYAEKTRRAVSVSKVLHVLIIDQCSIGEVMFAVRADTTPTSRFPVLKH